MAEPDSQKSFQVGNIRWREPDEPLYNFTFTACSIFPALELVRL